MYKAHGHVLWIEATKDYATAATVDETLFNDTSQQDVSLHSIISETTPRSIHVCGRFSRIDPSRS